MGSIPIVQMAEMRSKIQEAVHSDKYSFVIDMNGNADTYFKYQGRLFDFYKEWRAYKRNEQTYEHTVEQLRSNMVEAMRFGKMFCINFGDRMIKMSECKSKHFQPDLHLDFERGRLQDNYFKMIMADEKYDNHTRKINGAFHMTDTFNVVYLTESMDEDDLQTMINNLPHDRLEVMIVQ